MMKKVITFIMAGGKGERLLPLTRDRAKPAVPFGGIYRIIDFTLSNCINSGLRRIYVLTQYKSISLHRHIRMGWSIFSSELGEFVELLPAQQRVGNSWYLGTADAIYQNIYTIEMEKPDEVLILAGDHVYKMNYYQMIDFHRCRVCGCATHWSNVGPGGPDRMGVNARLMDPGALAGAMVKKFDGADTWTVLDLKPFRDL